MARDKIFEELYTYIYTIMDDHITPKTDVFRDMNDVRCVPQRDRKSVAGPRNPSMYCELGCHLMYGCNHVTPKNNVFRERNAFYASIQKYGESVADFAARIRSLSIYCDFGDHLETILIDKFVFGLKTGRVKDRVCEKKPAEITTLDQVLAIAQANELCVMNESQQNNELNGTEKTISLGCCEICGKLDFR